MATGLIFLFLLKPFSTLRNIHFFKLFLFIYSFKFDLIKTVIKPNFMIKKINVTFTQKFKQMRLQLNKKEKPFFSLYIVFIHQRKICHDERMFDMCINF